MRELQTALLAVHPEATRAVIGQHRVWRFRDQTPAHTFDSVLMPVDDKRFIELTARDSFDETLARFILDCLEGQRLPTHGSGKIRVVPVEGCPSPWGFDSLVLVPPRVAGRFGHQSRRLRLATYWALPAFQGEFEDGASREEFWHQVYRKDGWRVVVVRWDRSRKARPVFDG